MAAFIDTTKGEASAADSAGLPVHTDANLQPVSGLPHSFEVLRHVWIPMKDGVRLAARVWLPQVSPAHKCRSKCCCTATVFQSSIATH